VGLDYRDYVKLDQRFSRPAEVDLLVGKATKARQVLGWQPRYTFKELVSQMVQFDLDLAARRAESNALAILDHAK
jgi:GDPmannose 4,6-dehydratase